MSILLVYQIPIFKCPFPTENWLYLSVEECNFVISKNSNDIFGDMGEGKNNLVLFILGTIGLVKINLNYLLGFSKETLMLVFFFMALMLHQIYNDEL